MYIAISNDKTNLALQRPA